MKKKTTKKHVYMFKIYFQCMHDDLYPKDKYHHRAYFETLELGARKIEMRDDLISEIFF